jgi:dihydrofolate synthase / folylpolyglutamate synthase
MSKPLAELEQLLNELYSRERSGMNLDLSVTRQLLRALGDPQEKYKIIHIAGTNGKGSVASMVANTLRVAGCSVGLYTSPHLIEFGERLQVNGQIASTEEIIRLFRCVDEAAQREQLRVTFFEAVTAMAFVAFAEAAVEYAVVEVGLGGRLDATNVCHPLACAIVTIDFDHMQYLGDTLAQIAKEKAGIAKPNIPMVCGEIRDEARVAIAQSCAQANAPLSVLGEDFFFVTTKDGLSYRGPSRKIDGIPLSLLGPHQRHNAAVAVRLLEVLDPTGEKFSDEQIRRGFGAASWPGRLERFEGEIPVLLDGAHNPHGARALRAALDALYLEQKIHLVFGASGDKPAAEMLSLLLPRLASLTACQSKRKGALEQVEILRVVQALSPSLMTFSSSSVATALQAARQRAVSGDVVLVAGSLFVVGEARVILLQEPMT